MQAVYRREYAVLQPSQIQFVVALAEKVSAYVVRPPSVACVGSERGEIGLEFQTVPTHYRIPRKSERIAVRAEPCVS